MGDASHLGMSPSGGPSAAGTRMRLIFKLILTTATLAPMLAEPAHALDSAVYLAT
jgi:hypothetical protein